MPGPEDFIRRLFDPTGALPGLAPPLGFFGVSNPFGSTTSRFLGIPTSFGGGTTTEQRAGELLTRFFESSPSAAQAGMTEDMFDTVVGLIEQGWSDDEILQAIAEANAGVLEEDLSSLGSALTLPGGGTTGTQAQPTSAEDVSALVQALIELGFPPDVATAFVTDDPEGAFRLVQGALGGGTGGSGGGSSRFLFPEEQEAMRLQNALLQRELESNPFLEVIQDPTTGNTLLLDTQTGQTRTIGQFGFPQISPERQFALETAGVTGFLDGQPTLARELGVAAEQRLRANLELQRQVNQGQLNLSAADQDRLRRQIEADVQAVNQQADIARFDRLTDILRNPADFVARAFLTRGQTPPSGEITQADLLNALREEIRDVEMPNFQLDIMDIFNRNQLSPLDFSLFEGAQAPAPTSAPAPAPAPTGGGGGGGTTTALQPMGAFTGDTTHDIDLFSDLLAAGADPAKLSEFQRIAQQQAAFTPTTTTSGGTSSTTTSRFLPFNEPDQTMRATTTTGDTEAGTGFRSGQPIGGTLFAFADGTSGARSRFNLVGEEGPELVIQHGDGTFDVVPNDMLASDIEKKARRKGVSRFQLGTINQDQLRDLESSLRPPAVDAVFGGQRPDDLRFDFPLTTPMQFSELTPDERRAFGTTLAVQENVSLSDLEHAMRRRFGPTRERARAVLAPGQTRFGL